MSAHDLNNIIIIFLQRNVCELSDSDLSEASSSSERKFSSADIRRIVESFGWSLFLIQENVDVTFTVRVEPTIFICDDFLAGQCASKIGECDRLHLCRHFVRCMIKDCRFPHDFSRGANSRIVAKANCLQVNPVLLVQLLKLKRKAPYSCNQPILSTASSMVLPKVNTVTFKKQEPSHRTRGRRGRGSHKQSMAEAIRDESNHSLSSRSVFDVSHPLQMSVPCAINGVPVRIEKIEQFLEAKGYRIRNRISLQKNANFHVWSILLENDSDSDRLVAQLVLPYEGTYLRFKPTTRDIDSRSFVLQTVIDSKRGPMPLQLVSNYVDFITNQCPRKLTDLSSSSEHLFLVQCSRNLDMNVIRRRQRSRRQLSGNNMTLIEIYEIDTATVEPNANQLSDEIILAMTATVDQQIFTFNVQSLQVSYIEFIDTEACQSWLSTCGEKQKTFNVNIKPNVQYKRDEKESVPAVAAAKKVGDLSSPKEIHVRRAWAMVINHPVFGVEYRDFIRSTLGYDVEIRNDQVRFHDNPMKTFNASALNNHTSTFMKRFAFRSVSLNQKTTQLEILNAHRTTVAFRHTNNNNYMLATKSSFINAFMQKLTSTKPLKVESVNHEPPPVKPRTATKLNSNYAQWSEPLSIPLPTPNSFCTEDKPIPIQDITKNVLLPSNLPQINLFKDKTFEIRVIKYFDTTYHVEILFGLNIGNDSRHVVHITGQPKSVDKAEEELCNIISLCCTRVYNAENDSMWTKLRNAVGVIQYQLSLANVICVCQQQTSPIMIQVHHIDKKHSEFGVDAHVLDACCRHNLIAAECTILPSNTFAKEWLELKQTILQRIDYGKSICLADVQQTITLYGLSALVKQYQITFDRINAKDKVLKSMGTAPVPRPPAQVVEKPSLPTQIGPITTMTSTVAPQLRSITFDVDEPGFEVLVNQEFHRLESIVLSPCSITKQIISSSISILVPKAKFFDDNLPTDQPQETNTNHTSETPKHAEPNWFVKLFMGNKPKTSSSSPPQSIQQPPTSSTTLTSLSINIDQPKIIVCTGDLKTQKADVLVLCSNSKILCENIVSGAGIKVESFYKQQSALGMMSWETDAGNLPCKKIVFRPWRGDKNQPQDLKEEFKNFIGSVITFAVQHNFSTIAFPSVGCGQLGHDPKVIAEYMIREAYQQLKNTSSSQLTISFVIHPNQSNVFDAFTQQLKILPIVADQPIYVPFNKQLVRITLTGPNDTTLKQCQTKIQDLARSSSCKVHLTDKADLADWPQDTIKKYYEHCLQQRVIPTIDVLTCTLDLIGSKEVVSDAEKYFYQLTNEVLRHARVQVSSRGYVWSVEVSPGKWERYSNRVNELIEDGQMKKKSHIEFTNDKSEQCRIHFNLMEEHYQQRKRKVDGKRLDSSFPTHWDLSRENLKRVTLANSSSEYREVLTRFDSTMKNQYRAIVRIERIQNQRWYKQYIAHREEFQQRYNGPNEKLLFHGCPSVSAEKIIKECFNRTFAGVNGVAYGGGVYFHAHAKYSHSYTKSEYSGERTMFLARVLIGKTTLGNHSMKVPPEGFDTTTDGAHIFVVYHDAGAYGEYLITYK